MSLAEYKKKRHFGKTPEPPGEKEAVSKNRFVIHWHDARSLHFDLRLESEGVLKSWAIPKGLPNYKGDRKLAVHVEDHPVDYIDFKGVIPSGEYGAGKVDIWDKGTYQPIADFSKGFDKGKLQFFLSGDKVKGSFTLARIKGKNWLLLIHNIKDFMSHLAKAGAPMDMPREVEAMKAVLMEKPFNSGEWLFEIKWDGIRAISYIQKEALSMLSRKQKEQAFRYPELADIPNLILGEKAVVDGEIVTLTEQGMSSFELLQQRMNLDDKREIEYWREKLPVIYYLFDILYWNGRDLRNLPLIERKKILEKVVMPGRHLKLSEYIDSKGISFYEAAKEKGLEGIVAKRKSSPYISARASDWQKIKIVQEQEVVIGGFTEPRGTRPYFGALLLGVYDKGELVYAGHAGTGFSEKTLKELYEKMVSFEVDNSAFSVTPKTNEKAHWLKPELVAQVKFAEWTKKGYMRQPVYLGLRPDKLPKEVVREKPGEAT